MKRKGKSLNQIVAQTNRIDRIADERYSQNNEGRRNIEYDDEWSFYDKDDKRIMSRQERAEDLLSDYEDNIRKSKRGARLYAAVQNAKTPQERDAALNKYNNAVFSPSVYRGLSVG